MEHEIENKLSQIINQVKGTDAEFCAEDNFIEQLSMDSMDIIQVIVAIQHEFGLDFFGNQIDIDILNEFGRLADYIKHNAVQAPLGSEL
ncbi:phosphopantetheine-binding protein [Paenibacillus woosongensis]|uniref:Phosphopantetheine-binding protein n=1 Tax=Paenibacillus woosongensis TaxID=307580 RepID=A0AA95KTZ3_9BACL|nr:phosphopantetheine-binding protein [Paenibacillus woosongensis]WHX49433.1 phosphopantetheine-binding protein [Paenibacillus woosongensis]